MIGKRGMVEGESKEERKGGHSIIQASLTLWHGHSHRIGAPASSLQEKKERVFSWDCLCFFLALSFPSRNFHLLCVGGNLLGSIGAPVQVNFTAAAAAAKSLQSCPTLCDPIDGSPPGSPVPGILQAKTLESVAISFSNA